MESVQQKAKRRIAEERERERESGQGSRYV